MTTMIVGAGASGLACAITLKQHQPQDEVLVLERLPQAGRKILATGNGRCNLTNTRSPYYEPVRRFFEGIGLVTRVDEEGRVYPYSLQATTVLALLLKECERLGVQLVTDCTVLSVDKDLAVTTDSGIYMADTLVIATGGKAQPALGSNGSGYALLKALGHTVTPLAPALVQLTSPSKYPRQLKGQRVKASMAILLDGERVSEEYGEVLFTDYGLSGIVTMNLSEAVSRNFESDAPRKCMAELDLVPELSEEALTEYVSRYGSLLGILGETMAQAIEKQANGDSSKYAAYAKHWRLILNGTKGYDFAQITSGGVPLSEFDGFRSRCHPHVYACGEVLDAQYECGGYNLSFAWYSGIKAAEAITGKTYDQN